MKRDKMKRNKSFGFFLIILSIFVFDLFIFNKADKVSAQIIEKRTEKGKELESSKVFQNRFQEIIALNKARNIVRATAERINGGVEVYRTEVALHRQLGEQHVQDKGDSWIISFFGGTPEEVSIKNIYSIYTVIKINKKTFETQVLYNGKIPSDVLNNR